MISIQHHSYRARWRFLIILTVALLWAGAAGGAMAQGRTAPTAADTAGSPQPGIPKAAAAAESIPTGPYVLRSVDFHVQGRTKDFVLMGLIDPYQNLVGSSFPDRASLEAFVADKVRNSEQSAHIGLGDAQLRGQAGSGRRL